MREKRWKIGELYTIPQALSSQLKTTTFSIECNFDEASAMELLVSEQRVEGEGSGWDSCFFGLRKV